MDTLPAPDLRSNRCTWAIPGCQLPAVAAIMRNLYPTEEYDPSFLGQELETTYFDTRDFRLRRQRHRKDQYLTLRVRCYGGKIYALSAKTENQKFRVEINDGDAEALLAGLYQDFWQDKLPIDLLTRLLSITTDELIPVVTVGCRRYAVQDTKDRFTLDVDVRTDTGKHLPFHVLEFKSTRETPPPGSLQSLALRPTKLSKFLWATIAR